MKHIIIKRYFICILIGTFSTPGTLNSAKSKRCRRIIRRAATTDTIRFVPLSIQPRLSTPLHDAIISGNGLKKLLEDGEAPDTLDKSGQTALHLAARLNSATSIAILLSNNADPLLKDATGCTPLDIARTQAQPNENIIKLLFIRQIQTSPTYRAARKALEQKFARYHRKVPELIDIILQFAFPIENV